MVYMMRLLRLPRQGLGLFVETVELLGVYPFR